MIIGNYELQNEEKLGRVLEGTLTGKGQLVGGLTKLPDWNEKSEEEKGQMILVEYDRLGGLVLKEGLKVKTGTFYNIKLKKANEEIVDVYEESIDGELIEVDEEEAKALKTAKKKTAEIKKKKAKK